MGPVTLAEQVRENARRDPRGTAFITPADRYTWEQYDSSADAIAGLLVGLGLAPGSRVALQLPDGLGFHAALTATSRAGLVAVGLGMRAGDREVAHLLQQTAANALITVSQGPWRPVADQLRMLAHYEVGPEFHINLTESAEVRGIRHVPSGFDINPHPQDPATVAERSLGPDDLCMLNSTSGTTGLPKCVTQRDSRWFAFHRLATEAGELSTSDVFLGAVPGPFGFGLWTSHYTPTLLGAPTVLLPRFDVQEMTALIQRERVSVLSCVSTQFRLLLNSPGTADADLSSLRVMFTGGEAVSPERATEFEERTGATVLQFFGSNETGALSCTTLADKPEKRLTTAGRSIPEMHVRLFDERGEDVTAAGGPGQPAGKGPLTCDGYYEDAPANRELYTEDGWMLMGDLVTIDDEGYLTVIGRTSDIIIRGGKNISAAKVEESVESHPQVDLVAVVSIPDPVFGERACAVVTLRQGMLSLEALKSYLSENGFSTELFPEYLVVVDDLPRASGGKLAKGPIRELAAKSLAESGQAAGPGNI